MPKPLIVLAFANELPDASTYLRQLPKEANGLREIMLKAEALELCEFELLYNATVEMIVEVFQRPQNRNRIAVFHYGGHAGSYELLLRDADGKTSPALKSGLVKFLAGKYAKLGNGFRTRQ